MYEQIRKKNLPHLMQAIGVDGDQLILPHMACCVKDCLEKSRRVVQPSPGVSPSDYAPPPIPHLMPPYRLVTLRLTRTLVKSCCVPAVRGCAV
jgi:hypothetical protein